MKPIYPQGYFIRKRPQIISQRLAQMKDMYEQGMTLAQIGREYGITKQRVSQLFQDAGIEIKRRNRWGRS